MAGRKMAPVHPGEILREEFLEPMGISQYRLSKDIGVPPRRINEIVRGNRAISPDAALRLARYFGMSETFWSNLQAHYEQEVQRDALGHRLEKEVAVYGRADWPPRRRRRPLHRLPMPAPEAGCAPMD